MRANSRTARKRPKADQLPDFIFSFLCQRCLSCFGTRPSFIHREKLIGFMLCFPVLICSVVVVVAAAVVVDVVVVVVVVLANGGSKLLPVTITFNCQCLV